MQLQEQGLYQIHARRPLPPTPVHNVLRDDQNQYQNLNALIVRQCHEREATATAVSGRATENGATGLMKNSSNWRARQIAEAMAALVSIQQHQRTSSSQGIGTLNK